MYFQELLHWNFSMAFRLFHLLHLRSSNFLTTVYLPLPKFISLHFLMISTKFKLHLIYHFRHPFSKTYLAYRRESLKYPQVVGSRAVWFYLQSNIVRYLSFALCS
jgi:hypothetical protein